MAIINFSLIRRRAAATINFSLQYCAAILFKNHVYIIFESGAYFVFWCGYNLQRDTVVLFSRVWNHSALAQVQLLFQSSIYSSAASDLSHMAYQITAHLLWYCTTLSKNSLWG